VQQAVAGVRSSAHSGPDHRVLFVGLSTCWSRQLPELLRDWQSNDLPSSAASVLVSLLFCEESSKLLTARPHLQSAQHSVSS
jgi:hypothetical protein